MSTVSTIEASRRSPLHDRWAVRIKKRDHWKCWGCGMSRKEIEDAGGTLEAAHWLPHSEYPDHRYLMENGRALCTFRNRRHPKGHGRGYGCHNAASGHWNGDHGFANAVPNGHRHRPRNSKHDLRRSVAASWALLAAGVLWAAHQALWGWAALAVSLALWPALGISTALWVLLLVLNFHLRHDPGWRPYTLGTPATFGGWLSWMAGLIALWGALLWGTAAALAHRWLGRLTGAVWGWVPDLR